MGHVLQPPLEYQRRISKEKLQQSHGVQSTLAWLFTHPFRPAWAGKESGCLEILDLINHFKLILLQMSRRQFPWFPADLVPGVLENVMLQLMISKEMRESQLCVKLSSHESFQAWNTNA